MSSLLIGLLSALAAANVEVAVSNYLTGTPGFSVELNLHDPAEAELGKLMEADDAAMKEVDEWIRENRKFAAQGAGVSNAELNRRIEKRFEPIRKSYEDYIRAHPKSAKARVAYASFLHDTGREGEAEQLEKARELNPKDPAIWNNLANYYGEFGSPTNAFRYYAKAIELDSNEPVYYQNFATTVCMFRKDAREFYHISEQQVFDKSLELYAKAMELDPTDFPLATDVAQTYYLIQPPRFDQALKAWTNALHVAEDEVEREGVYLHFARLKIRAGRLDEARVHLGAITNAMYQDLKKRLERVLADKVEEAKTNRPAENASEKAP